MSDPIGEEMKIDFRPRFYVRPDQFQEGVELRFGYRDEGALYVADPITIRKVDPTFPLEIPAMVYLSHEQAKGALQHLMDELWRHGVRPSDIGTPGHLAATTRHLEDMRAIAFAKLEVPKP